MKPKRRNKHPAKSTIGHLRLEDAFLVIGKDRVPLRSMMADDAISLDPRGDADRSAAREVAPDRHRR